MAMLLLLLTVLGSTQTPTQAPINFSGTWVFDEARSSQKQPGGHLIIAKLLGDEVTIRQDQARLRLTIHIGPSTVDAEYTLDGSESRNLSSEGRGKPDVTVTSRATWEDGKLVIRSTSTTEVQGTAVTTETKRVLWIDADGSLILDRTGTPATEVPASRSVYRKVR